MKEGRNGIINSTCWNHNYHFPLFLSCFSCTFQSALLLHNSSLSDNLSDTQGLPNPFPSPSPSWSLWSVGVNQCLALTQIGNKCPCAHETIMSGLQWKWIPALTLYTGLLFSWPMGSCHGKQLLLDASWQPDSIASTISPHPQAFSGQIASSTLKSNLLPTIGFYQTNRSFSLFPWTMQWE